MHVIRFEFNPFFRGEPFCMRRPIVTPLLYTFQFHRHRRRRRRKVWCDVRFSS